MDRVYLLKSNGHTVLNFFDLQEHFSPWEFLTQTSSFEKFAKVHCVPLTTWIKGEKGGKTKAKYINKEFWLKVLCRDWACENLDEAKSATDYIYDFSNQECVDIAEQEAKKTMESEINSFSVDEKIQFIFKQADLSQNKEDKITAMMLLALCELAEFDAREQSFQRWVQDNVINGAQSNSDGEASEQGSENSSMPEVMPNVSKIALKTSAIAYRFLYHESDVLQADKIKTVRVEAVDNGSETVTVELCRENGEVYEKLEMFAGEYRDCNVADGKIIRFLPTLSISDTLCIARKDYSSGGITVIPRDAMEWTLNIDSSIAKKITSFAAGDNDTEGFLCIRDGKLMRGFYKPNDNYKTRQRFDMIKDRLVEVRLVNGYFELLTETGRIVSDNTERNGLSNVITLYPRERQNLPDAREAAHSTGGMSYVEHKIITEECEVHFE